MNSINNLVETPDDKSVHIKTAGAKNEQDNSFTYEVDYNRRKANYTLPIQQSWN